MFETKKTSSKKTGRGNTIIATSAIIPNGKIPDLTISEKPTWELLDYLKKLDIDSWYNYLIQNAK